MHSALTSFPLFFGSRLPKTQLGDGTYNPLQLIRIQIEQQVNVNFPLIHQVATTMTFFNNENRVLEGALEFSLPETATVCGYGLDVEGQIVDGVVVEKQAARVAFEKEVRKGVDPGFVELVAGNVFRTRVYPILPKQTRVVRVIYQDQSKSNSNNNDLSYRIPISFTNSLQSFDLAIRCFGRISSNSMPIFLDTSPFPNENYPKFNIDADGQCVLGWNLTNLSSPTTGRCFIEYSIPNLVTPTMSAFEIDSESEGYFAISLTIPSVVQVDFGRERSIFIVWDASISRGDAHESRQLEINALKKILDSWLTKYNSISLSMVIIRNDLEQINDFMYSFNSWPDLKKILDEIVYDGATNLAQLSDLTLPTSITHCFIFSDCMSTFGHLKLTENSFTNLRVPIWIFNGNNHDLPVDHGFIHFLTENINGGGYFDRTRLESSTEDLIKSLDRVQIKYLGTKNIDMNISQIYPSRSMTIATDLNRFLLVGKISLPSKTSVEGQLQFGLNHDVSTFPFSIDINSTSKKSNFGLIRRLWAQQKLRELSVFKEKNRREIIKLGIEYSLVTDFTSLMVLETLHQHLQYSICPAKTRKQLYTEYLKYQKEKTTDKPDKTLSLNSMWINHCQWYDKIISDTDIHRAYLGYTQSMNPFNQTSLFGGNAFHMQQIPQYGGFNNLGTTFNQTVPNQYFGFGSGSNMNTYTLSALPSIPAMMPQTASSANGFSFGSSLTTSANSTSNFGPQSFSPAGTTGTSTIFAAMPAPTHIEEKSTEQPTNAFIVEDSDVQKSTKNRLENTDSIEAAYKIYLSERVLNRQSPSFYFDVASLFFEYYAKPSALNSFNKSTNIFDDRANLEKRKMYGIRILTNILELNLEAPQLLRTVAYKLMELNEYNHAVDLFLRIYELRPDEPQSLHDLALAYIELGQDQQAIECLKKIFDQSWDTRFQGIESIAFTDFNRLVTKQLNQGIQVPVLNKNLNRHLPLDIRVVLQWDEPDTNLSLMVTEPTGEICSPSKIETGIGGFMKTVNGIFFGRNSNRVPQEYRLKKAISGSYTIDVTLNHYSGQSGNGTTTAIVYMFKNFGSSNEEKQIRTIRLNKIGEKKTVARLEIEPPEISKLQRELEKLKAENLQLRDKMVGVKTSSSSSITHENVICDSCQRGPIVGLRYKCLFCPNIDFCEDCLNSSTIFGTEHNVEHPLICVRNSSSFPNSIQLLNRSGIVHAGISCSICSRNPIVGIRFQCQICSINICEQCEFSGLHDIRHPKTKFTFP